jgi:hypothetical protein
MTDGLGSCVDAFGSSIKTSRVEHAVYYAGVQPPVGNGNPPRRGHSTDFLGVLTGVSFPSEQLA